MAVYPRLIISDNNSDEVTKIETDLVPLSSGGIRIIIEGVFLIVLTTIWTVMRLWCRRIKRVPILIEDWLHLAALVFFYGQVATCFVSVAVGGAGHHLSELQPWHIVRFSKAIFVVQVMYALAVGLVKISITVLLMRIFVSQRIKLAGGFIIGLSVLWTILTILVGLLLCKPITQNWEPTPDGTCGNQYVGFGIVAAIDIFNEICLIILPIPSVWKLHLPQRYRIALAGVFGTGIITLVVAAFRVPVLLETDFTDLTYDTRSQQVALAEPAIAIIISCSPILKPAFDKVLMPILGTITRRTTESRSDPRTKNSDGTNRARVKAKSHGYAKVGDSDELIELGNRNLQTANQGTEISATGRPSIETTQKSEQDNGTSGIVVRKETIITHSN